MIRTSESLLDADILYAMPEEIEISPAAEPYYRVLIIPTLTAMRSHMIRLLVREAHTSCP